MSKKRLSLAEAAVKVLRDAGKPLHYRDICQQVLEQELVELTSKTPAASLHAVFVVDMKRGPTASLELLALVAEQGPARPGELVDGWGDYLERRSRFGTEGTIKDTLHRRLRNLLERGLVSRSSARELLLAMDPFHPGMSVPPPDGSQKPVQLAAVSTRPVE